MHAQVSRHPYECRERQAPVRARIAGDADDLADLLPPHVAVTFPGEGTVLRLPPEYVIRAKDWEDAPIDAATALAGYARSSFEPVYRGERVVDQQLALEWPGRVFLCFVDCEVLPLKVLGELCRGPLAGPWVARERRIVDATVDGAQAKVVFYDVT